MIFVLQVTAGHGDWQWRSEYPCCHDFSGDRRPKTRKARHGGLFEFGHFLPPTVAFTP
jgi:hypothetical protein